MQIKVVVVGGGVVVVVVVEVRFENFFSKVFDSMPSDYSDVRLVGASKKVCCNKQLFS